MTEDTVPDVMTLIKFTCAECGRRVTRWTKRGATITNRSKCAHCDDEHWV